MEKTGRCLNKEERISSNRLTRFERSGLLGRRAVQIDNDAPIFVDIDGETSSYEIALKELMEKKIPLNVERILPNGDWEIWTIDELVI
jgi:DNA-directed RNA polymerases I, II, and III subunit RPABC2